MLREHKDIDRHSHWSDCKKKLESDWRYRVVESTITREDWFRDYVRLLKDERKKEKERDKDHRHKDKDHHKSDKKDKDKKEEKGKRSSKENNDKGGPKEKKLRRSESISEDASKDKVDGVEKETGEIDEPEDKNNAEKSNDVEASFFFLPTGIDFM